MACKQVISNTATLFTLQCSHLLSPSSIPRDLEHPIIRRSPKMNFGVSPPCWRAVFIQPFNSIGCLPLCFTSHSPVSRKVLASLLYSGFHHTSFQYVAFVFIPFPAQNVSSTSKLADPLTDKFRPAIFHDRSTEPTSTINCVPPQQCIPCIQHADPFVSARSTGVTQ